MTKFTLWPECKQNKSPSPNKSPQSDDALVKENKPWALLYSRMITARNNTNEKTIEDLLKPIHNPKQNKL